MPSSAKTKASIDWDMVFKAPTQKWDCNDESAEFFRNWKTNRLKNDIEMCIAAAVIKINNQDQKKGGGTTMGKSFNSWWNNNKMNQVFGSKSTFYRYAQIGAFLGDAKKNSKLKKHIDQLPPSVTALNEIMAMNDKEIELCFKDTYKRESVGADPQVAHKGKNPKPLIHPGVTAAEIKRWWKLWLAPPQKREDDRIVPVITVKANIKTLLDASEDGSAMAHPEMYGLANEIADAVTKIVAKYNASDFVAVPNLVKIAERQTKARNKQVEKYQKENPPSINEALAAAKAKDAAEKKTAPKAKTKNKKKA